ncbi:MAG TPA: family 65 glycosyl hydrolase [Clostridiaceae bacterium]|nr:family 65 glycosyl hydrolase [Clostridiaceae bacterium]
MAKIADRYFVTDPWNIIEEGFNPSYSQVAESIFSLGNEYMGTRGFFDEGYSGQSLIGNYFNGVYARLEQTPSAYKGMVNSTEFMVNSVNWLYTRIKTDDEMLDLNNCVFSNFRRVLNMRDGLLKRSFTWTTKSGKILDVVFERFVSMGKVHIGAQKISVTPVNFSGKISIISGLDFSEPHRMFGKNFWDCENKVHKDSYLSITGKIESTKKKVFSSCFFSGDIENKKDVEVNPKAVAKEFILNLSPGRTSELVKIVSNIVCTGSSREDLDLFEKQCIQAEQELEALDYHTLKEENKAWWEKVWNNSDIVIRGDKLNQQGIRFCIFQMFQTYHGAKKGTNIGAKGLTGEAYSGNAFWDTEVYCLPFYIFNNIEAAKNLLFFRYVTLPEARQRASELDCEGAFYPIATISGRECCTLWQHANLQLQASTAVVYGIWFYDRLVDDKSFLFDYGLPILVEVSRMLATRGSWTENGTKYGFFGVMGPDEFQMMVNHNCYTNYMGRFTFYYTLSALEQLKQHDEREYDDLISKMGISAKETEAWKSMADHMFIPYDGETKLYEQHDGYFKLPHVDIHSIPVEEFPLYHHWSYDRIYRNDMIKQPDVLMLMLMFNSRFSEEEILKNYEFYEPRCIHESSLSPSVHSILASQLKKHSEAYDFFRFATRMDLDNYNRNTHEGLHTTSIAAAWMNIVYGFGGMRSDVEPLSFAPSVPAEWDGYSFRITYKNNVILVDVSKDTVTFTNTGNDVIPVKVYGKTIMLGKEAQTFEVPADRRG